MVVVERVEYQLTEELLDSAALAVVPDFVPPPAPKHSPQTIKQLLMACAGCFGLLLICLEHNMPVEHFFYLGFCVVACVLLLGLPKFAKSVNNGLVRFTRYSQQHVRKKLHEGAVSALGSTVRWEFDEEGFRTILLDNVRRVPWTDLKRVRALGNFWLFAIPKQELFLPASAITPPARELIRRKVKERGVKFVER
jgi:hypothetical protein